MIIVSVPFLSGVVSWAHVTRGGDSHLIAYVKDIVSPLSDELALSNDLFKILSKFWVYIIRH